MAREFIAEALVHAAAGLLRNQSKPGSATRDVMKHPLQSAEEAGADAAAAVGSAASNTLSTVARAVDSLLGYLQKRDLEADEAKPQKRKSLKGKKRKAKKRGGDRFAEEQTTH